MGINLYFKYAPRPSSKYLGCIVGFRVLEGLPQPLLRVCSARPELQPGSTLRGLSNYLYYVGSSFL